MTKILVIDDDRIYMKLLEVLLKNSYPDYEIFTTQSGPEGIEKAKKELPDIIILDIIMPDMDGYEVCKRLQSDEYTQPIPVIFLTVYETDSKNVIRGLESGALSFLSKPIGKDHLIAQVNVALRIRKAEKALRESEAGLKNAQQIAHMGSYESDLKSDQSVWSEEFYHVVGVEPGTPITNEKISKLIHPNDSGMFSQAISEMIEKKATNVRLEYRIIQPDGKIRWLDSQTRLIYDSDGEAIKLIGTAIDITERKQAEEELKQKMKQLERFNKVAVDRELRMIELKREINELLEKAGLEKKYSSPD